MRLLLLLVSAHFAWAASFPFSGQTVVYPVDPKERGAEIIQTYQTLLPSSSLSFSGTQQYPAIAIQTTLSNPPGYAAYNGMQNGIVPYIQKILGTQYNTLLILSYQPPSTSFTEYIVLPVEQVISLLYYPTRSYPMSTSYPFTSTMPGGVFPYFSIDPQQRAYDIASAFSTLQSIPAQTSSPQVWIQTTLNGPFNPTIPNGLLKNVLSVQVSHSLLQIQFKDPRLSYIQTIYTAPEQIQQIFYILLPYQTR